MLAKTIYLELLIIQNGESISQISADRRGEDPSQLSLSLSHRFFLARDMIDSSPFLHYQHALVGICPPLFNFLPTKPNIYSTRPPADTNFRQLLLVCLPADLLQSLESENMILKQRGPLSIPSLLQQYKQINLRSSLHPPPKLVRMNNHAFNK